MAVLRLMASRHSAFYSPLIGAIAGGFLQEEGFEPVYTPLPAGKTVAQLLTAGEIDVAQSAVSASWGILEQGQQPPTVHFAQINERDGFLIAARRSVHFFVDLPDRTRLRPEELVRYACQHR